MSTATRVHETPNAVMTTLASPSLNQAETAMWRVEMEPGAAGPVHVVDAEQVIVVLDGTLAVTLDGQEHVLGAGEAITLPAGSERRIIASGPGPAIAVATSRPEATAQVPGGDPVPIPWAR